MGVNLRLSSDGFEHETDLCANHGYDLLCDWLGSLDANSYPAAGELARDGQYEGTDMLADQLGAALAASPPDNPDVLHTAERLLDLIGDGRPHETVTIDS
jgi:hypothetical protein